MTNHIHPGRRRFLRTTALALTSAAQFGAVRSARAQPSDASAAVAPTFIREARSSLGTLKQIDAGVLNVGYADLGPAAGPAVLLLHRWPYDIHSCVDASRSWSLRATG